MPSFDFRDITTALEIQLRLIEFPHETIESISAVFGISVREASELLRLLHTVITAGCIVSHDISDVFVRPSLARTISMSMHAILPLIHSSNDILTAALEPDTVFLRILRYIRDHYGPDSLTYAPEHRPCYKFPPADC